ncbi:MAG: flippase [Bacteroidales bacterium]|nr:flippase [Bacteroidales bacterium]
MNQTLLTLQDQKAELIDFNKIKQDLHLTELIRGGATAMVFKGASIVFTYLLFFTIGRLFSPTHLGIFNTCWTVLMIGAVLGKIGLDTAIVKFIAETIAGKKLSELKSLYRTGALIVLAGSVISAGLIFLFSKPLSKLFFDTTDKAYLLQIIAITIIPLGQMSFNSESLRGMKKITLFSLFQNSSAYFSMLVLLLIFFLIFRTPEVIIPSLSLGIFILFIFSFFTVRKQLHQFTGNEMATGSSGLNVSSILKVSFPMLLSNSLFLVMNWTDTLMLSAFIEEDAVGIYNTALKIAALNSVALTAINSIAAPKFAELFSQNDHTQFRKLVKQTSLLSFVISFPVFIIIVALPGFLLSIFGEDFIPGTTALLILVAGQAFNAFAGSTMNVLHMTRKEKVGRNILTIGVIVNLILNYVLIPRYGINGAAIATASSTILWNSIAILYIYRVYGFFTFPVKI